MLIGRTPDPNQSNSDHRFHLGDIGGQKRADGRHARAVDQNSDVGIGAQYCFDTLGIRPVIEIRRDDVDGAMGFGP